MSFTMDQSNFNHLRSLTIGERLQFFRRMKMSTNRDERVYGTHTIAKHIGTTQQTLSHIERGETKNPSFVIVCKIAKYLGIPLDYFTNEYYENNNSFEEVANESY